MRPRRCPSACRRRCSNACRARRSRFPISAARWTLRSSSVPRRSFHRWEARRGWDARFGRELNATDDRGAFRPGRHGLPVVDGKHIEPFRAALDTIDRSIAAADARRLLRSDRHQHPRLAYRDVASATNRLTLIAAVLPAGCVSTHTVFCLRTPLPRRAHDFLCGLFNSFVVNYLVRLRVTTHVTTATVEQLPIPTPLSRAGGVHRDRRARAIARAPGRRERIRTPQRACRDALSADRRRARTYSRHISIDPDRNATRDAAAFQQRGEMNSPQRHRDTETQRPRDERSE